MKEAIKKAPQRTTVTTDDATSAFVPFVSKCMGHIGIHHGFVGCCLLKTSSVCAEVPRIAMLSTTTRPPMMACAMWNGAGLTFMLLDVFGFVLWDYRVLIDGR